MATSIRIVRTGSIVLYCSYFHMKRATLKAKILTQVGVKKVDIPISVKRKINDCAQPTRDTFTETTNGVSRN